MISIDNIGTLLREGGCNHIRIYDRNGTAHLLNIDDESVDNAIDKLKANIELLSGYGVLTIKGGNETVYKRSMAGASVWKVFFNQTANSNPNTQIQQLPVNNGYSKEYLETVIALNTLKLQMDFDKKERELEKKFSGGDEEKYFKYAPLLGSLFGWSDEEMLKKLQMCQMAGGLSGSQTQTFKPQQNKLTIEGTDSDKEKMVEVLVPQIFGKVDKDKFIAVLDAINKNPEFIESAYSYMSMTNNSGMAGQNMSFKSETIISDDNIYLGYVNPRHDEKF